MKAGLCLRFRRNTQRVLRLTLPTTGTAPLEQDGFTVELLPKLAFFTLWDRPPSSGLVRPPARDDPAGGLRSGGPALAEPANSPEPELMGGGAGPAVPSPDDAAPPDEAPADDAQAPIDLVSDTSESAGSVSESDHSSDVAIVEPVDQAAAVIPCAADLLAASDFTPHLLNDMHAPMVTVILEEQALAPARVLARVPYLDHLLHLVQQGCEPAQLPAACAPALECAHADLATYLATLMAGLFDQARLAALPEALADYQQLGDPTVVARTLLAQINYTADVAANMPPHTYTTGSGIFRFAWRVRQNSTTIVLRLRTVYMYLPQPIASCLRSPPEDTKPPILSSAVFPAAAPCPLQYIHARWKFTYPFTPPSSFVEWYMARLRFGPRLMAVCAHLRISPQLLEHTQIPELRAIVQIRVPLAGAPEGTALPKQPATADSLLQAGWRPDLVLQMPRERDQPALAELPVSLRQPQAVRPPSASPLLADNDPSGSIKHYFLGLHEPAKSISGTWSAQVAFLLGTTMPRATRYQELSLSG